jgi:outer membrane protein TolC
MPTRATRSCTRPLDVLPTSPVKRARFLVMLVISGGAALAHADLAKPEASPSKTYGLRQCVALADSNSAQIKQALDRLAQAHAQLDEIKWIPWSQFAVSGGVAVVPTVGGSQTYSPQSTLNLQGNNWGPAWRVQIDGVLPLWTFGKITSSTAAASANVDIVKADVDRWRLLVHHDVRRAYFGVLLAHDARYLLDFAKEKLDTAIKSAEDDANTDEVDVLRLKTYRAEALARRGEIEKGERTAMAALRFLTGLEAPSEFAVPDVPIAPPKKPLVDVLVYLKAAKLHRPELKQLEFGVAARKSQVDYAKARLYPDIGIGLSFGWASSPMIATQTNPFVINPANYLTYSAGVIFRWNLDLLPGAARVRFAEAQLDEVRDFQRYALGGVGVEVETAYAQAHDANIREQSYGEAETFAKRWVATISSAIAVGTREERELVDPLRSYLNDRFAHLQAIMDLDVAVSQLTIATGDESIADYD